MSARRGGVQRPGRNANAVKELVIAGMLMGARNLLPALNSCPACTATTSPCASRSRRARSISSAMSCRPHPRVIGLGAIGSLVADAAIRLGLNVIGFDPEITVDAAWRLPSTVKKAASVDELVKHSDFISLHTPLVPATKDLINGDR